jgi:hypothetical protein
MKKIIHVNHARLANNLKNELEVLLLWFSSIPYNGGGSDQMIHLPSLTSQLTGTVSQFLWVYASHL